MEAEREYERQRPKFSEVEWLSIFPEMKKRYGRSIKIGLQVQKIKAQQDIDFIDWWGVLQIKSARKKQFEDWVIEDMVSYYTREKIKKEKDLRAAEGRLKFFSTIGRKEVPGKEKKTVITETMVQRAKEYPIEKLLEVNRSGFTKCFNHNDSKPSAYCKKNFLYCFVCNKSWDSIAILTERDGYRFKEAVIRLQ